ncbi:hypothetical protein [Roseobacter litoralis]|uniref:hypothetical protein n=1 Tax=Roseobacter litoralis TaxID=42443 RepID=UPI0024954D05|nr:hypothetical protein [Roseobacter litoralis]
MPGVAVRAAKTDAVKALCTAARYLILGSTYATTIGFGWFYLSMILNDYSRAIIA